MNTQSPPNWVAERAKCNLDLTFEALFQIVQRDVEEANKLSAKRRRGFAFRLEQNGEGIHPLFSVRRFPEDDQDSNDAKSVCFEKSINAIRISAQEDDMLAYPRWNKVSHSCKIFLKDQPHELWEISHIVLGPLFFE